MKALDISTVIARKTRVADGAHFFLRDFQTLVSFFIVLISISPARRLIPNYLYAGVVILWLLIVFLCDSFGLYRAFWGRRGEASYLYAWSFYLIIAYLTGHHRGEFPTMELMTTFVLLMFNYYLDKPLILKKQITVAGVYISFILLNTIRILFSDSQIARRLTSRNNVDDVGLLTGGFGFSYAVAFLAPFILYCYERYGKGQKVWSKSLLLIAFMLCWVYLLLAQFTIAILISLALAFAVLWFCGKIPRRAFLIFLALSFLFMFAIYGSVGMEYFNERRKSADLLRTLFLRLKELFALSEHSVTDREVTGSMGYRFELYANSFRTFLSKPIGGVGYIYGSRDIVGEHSEVFDTLARYGLIGFIAHFLTFGLSMIKRTRLFVSEKILHILYLGYVAYLFLNPGIALDDGFMLLYFIPAILVIHKYSASNGLDKCLEGNGVERETMVLS